MFKSIKIVFFLVLMLFTFVGVASAEPIDYGRDYIATKDQGYISFDYTFKDYYCKDLHSYARKIDSAGEIQWEITLAELSRVHSAEELQDGGFILVGTRNNDVYVVKISANGNIEWEKTFVDDKGFEMGWLVKPCADGYIIAANRNIEADNYDIYLIRTDGTGNVKWKKTFGTKLIDKPLSIISTNLGWLVTYKIYGSSDTIQLAEINAFGELLWEGESKTE